MKKNIFYIINIIFWISLTIVLMAWVSDSWENYNIVSFFVSFFIHGGLCFLFGYIIHLSIKDYFQYKEIIKKEEEEEKL